MRVRKKQKTKTQDESQDSVSDMEIDDQSVLQDPSGSNLGVRVVNTK